MERKTAFHAALALVRLALISEGGKDWEDRLKGGFAGIPAKVLDEAAASLDAAGWEEVFDLADKQHILGLVASGALSLQDTAMRADTAMRFANEQDIIEEQTERIDDAASTLVKFFRGAGLHPVVMKGPAAGALYPVPGRRESGDIDLFFPGGEFQRAMTALVSKGIAVYFDADGSMSYHMDSERTILVEHHRHFLDCRWQPEDPGCPEAFLLLLSSHILKHAMGWGVGLKQIVDYFVAASSPDYDRGKFADMVARAGLKRWQGLLDGFGGDLQKIVLDGANFGMENRGEKDSRLWTGLSFIRRIPFALKYAPLEWVHTVRGLIIHKV